MTINNTSECSNCLYCTFIGDKARLKIDCSIREKQYYFGQYLNCDNFTKKKEFALEEEECK